MSTENRPSLHTRVTKAHSLVTLIVGSIFSVVLIGFQAAQFLDTLATKDNLETTRKYIIEENTKLKLEVDALRGINSTLYKKQQELVEALTSHLELHAGRLAAERQPDKRKSAQSAEIARRKFREALEEGKTLEQAIMSTYPFM